MISRQKKGAYILPLGFIDEDFIYGAAKKDKVMVAAAGNTVFPMKKFNHHGYFRKFTQYLKDV